MRILAKKNIMVGIFLGAFLVLTRMGYGETAELVTYFPPANTDMVEFERIHTGGMTVGVPYSLSNPGGSIQGTLWVANWISAGLNLTPADFVLIGKLGSESQPRMRLGLSSLQFGGGYEAPDMVLSRPGSKFLRLENHSGNAGDGEATVFAIDGNRRFGHEATLALHLGEEPNVSYLDIYNMNYPGIMAQYGLRITKAGTDTLRPLVIDFFDGNTGTVAAEGVRILPDGKVGFGGVVPAEKLHVNGNGKITGALYLGAGAVDVAAKIAELEAEIEDLKDRVRALGG